MTDSRITSRKGRRAGLGAIVCLIAFCTIATSSSAQEIRSSDLLEHYMRSRTSRLAQRNSDPGHQRLTFRRPVILASKGDTLRTWFENLLHERLTASLPPPLKTFTVERWEVINRLKTIVYRDDFSRTKWSFTGSNSRAPLDTMKTADLRSRFEHHFGPPSITLAELGYPDTLQREQIIEFEYWFVLNDSINVIVMDVNGPWDRGVVLAADEQYRTELRVIKRTFLEQLVLDSNRKPFMDYYFNYDQRAWYLTGYDGASFFDERIQRPDLKLGRPAPGRRSSPSSEPLKNNQ